jgi:AraC-like DNA-binding protein
MPYREYAPTPALAPFVQCIWAVRTEPGQAAPRLQRVLPDGCMDVIFSFGDEPVGSFTLPDERARLIGSMTRADRFLLVPGTDLMGVRFHPGASGAFLRLGAHEVLDSSLPLVELWGRDTQHLQDELAGQVVDARRARVERELLRRLRPLSREHQLVMRAHHAIVRSRGRVAIDDLASAVGVSRRHLERAFVASVGHGPKVACRVVRLTATLRLADEIPDINQSRLALEGGYFDQAHMIREIKALSGATPRELIAERQGVAFVQSQTAESE